MQSYLKKSEHSLMVPEAKILFHLSVFLFGGVIATIIGDFFYYEFNEINETLAAYLDCESTGFIPGATCDRRSFDDVYRPVRILNDLGTISLHLFPSINLIYIVEVRKVKKWITKASHSLTHKSAGTAPANRSV